MLVGAGCWLLTDLLAAAGGRRQGQACHPQLHASRWARPSPRQLSHASTPAGWPALRCQCVRRRESRPSSLFVLLPLCWPACSCKQGRRLPIHRTTPWCQKHADEICCQRLHEHEHACRQMRTHQRTCKCTATLGSARLLPRPRRCGVVHPIHSDACPLMLLPPTERQLCGQARLDSRVDGQ
jgi:hypothetical protein